MARIYFPSPPPTDPERRHAKVQLQKTATHMTHTRNVPTIAHWRTSPRNAPTSRDLHDGISWQITSTALDAAECAHAHRAKNRPQTPKDGRERAPARQRRAHDECDACAGCLWRSEAAAMFDWWSVRGAGCYVGMVWGVPDASKRTCVARMTNL